jgi:hypothetical protein
MTLLRIPRDVVGPDEADARHDSTRLRSRPAGWVPGYAELFGTVL